MELLKESLPLSRSDRGYSLSYRSESRNPRSCNCHCSN